MVAKCTLGAVTKRLILIFNIFALVAAVHAVDGAMTEEAVVDEDDEPPHESVLPHVTITDEMKVGIFFDQLRVDYSIIDPANIVQSIRPWDQYIRQYSREYGVDPNLVRAIIYAESKGDPYRISRNGAVGLMQIMPSTADFLGIDNVLDPEENIKAGVMYIAWLAKDYDEEYALWAWNAGPGRIEQNKMPTETKRFIVEVLSVKTFLRDDMNSTI